jgi:hypothetical protein
MGVLEMKTKRLLLRSFIVALAGLWLGGSPSAHTATAADEGYKTVGGVTVYLGVVAAEIVFRCERRSRAADDSQDWPEKRTGRAGSFGPFAGR